MSSCCCGFRACSQRETRHHLRLQVRSIAPLRRITVASQFLLFLTCLAKHDRRLDVSCMRATSGVLSPSSRFCCSSGTAPRNSVKHTAAAAALAAAATLADCNQMWSFFFPPSARGKLLMLIGPLWVKRGRCRCSGARVFERNPVCASTGEGTGEGGLLHQ